MLKAVIFDMDGVLVDSEVMHAVANVQALKKFGLDMPMEYYLSFAGITKKEMMRMIIEKYNLNATVTEVVEEADRQNDILFEKDGFTPISGACDLVKQLYANGLTLAIASSSPYKDIYQVIEYFEIKDYFKYIISGSDENINPKPAPDIYKKVLNLLNMNANEVIAIEDTDHGLCAATGAGLKCAGYLNPNSGKQSLDKACKIITDFNTVDKAYLESLIQ